VIQGSRLADAALPSAPMFHPLVETWLLRRFGAPTPVQAQAWPVLAQGGDALITAPTGAGKTLAAFLACLDRLIVASSAGTLPDRTAVLYVSPLKALSNDVQKNLDEPIAEITALAAELGYAAPRITTAVRTGDTPQKERRHSLKHPPHVLVTTPESLFILLTSESGRLGLSQVSTIILDEIHAVAADKRGAHLALSVERLEDLVVRAGNPRPQRIGLSATIRPIETAARLLVGSSAPLPTIVDAGQLREIDLAIEVPEDELGAVCTNEQWDELYGRLAKLGREHRSTLIFVNTRRLVERVAFHLGERLGEDVVAAHHGSLSRARRFEAERRLKAGELRVVVATASLELGIDVGAIDLTCILGSPRSIGTALQRVGRSGHALARTPKGRFFPLTRDQLLECAAIVRAARRGVLDTVVYRRAPLDILAQQIVAVASAADVDEDEVFALMRRAAPYAELRREDYDAVLTMLSEGVATRRGRAGAMIHRDGVNRRLRGRRGARLAALTSGGAIPDTADYDVLLVADGTKIGKVGEDFAIDSSAGQTFLLGNTSWRIRRVETGKVWVEDAKGAPPSVPFWFGEAPARTQELSAEVASLRQEIADHAAASREAGLGLAQAVDRIAAAYALDRPGARLACEYVEAGRAALGAIPTLDTIVAERFFDDAGGMQLILHAPFGARINRGLGMALRKSFCRSFDFELQAAATDDGVLLSLGPQHSFPLESILELVRPDHLRETLEQAALQSPMFATRFRWDAGRSLALLRFQNGKRVPPAIQRMRSEDLMAAVFPASLGCQDNHGGLGAHVALPDHPIVNEAIRDCLEELMDIDGLGVVLDRLRSGAITLVAVETPEPSVFSHEILNANPYAFLDDAPLEERRARAVSVRRGLPAAIVDRLGGLDPEAIASVVREARPEITSADELHDRLLDLVALPELEAIARGWEGFFAALVRDRRAARFTLAALPEVGPSRVAWVAAERRSLALAIWNGGVFEPDLVAPSGSRGALPAEREEALVELVRARITFTGPITAAELGLRVDVPASDVNIALHRIELDGAVLRGRFTPGLPKGELEWCHRILLARIHRRTTDGLRRAIEPVSAADLMRFLFVWQGVRGAQHRGRAGLARVVEQLQGFEIAAGAWENEVLPARVMAYQSSWLDELCFSGEVVWGRLSPRDSGSTPTRAAPVTLSRRRDLAWLLAPRDARGPAPSESDSLSPPARAVLTLLERDGASFLDEIVASAGHARIEIEDALWELVARGRITGDGFSGLRALIERSRPEPVWKVGRLRGGSAPVSAGRWSLLRPPRAASETSVDAVVESLARLYLRRYGVVFRDLLGRESEAPPWGELVRVYRVLEMRGEIRGGHLVQATVGEQFALPEALDALRAIRREPRKGDVVRLSACDPLNLVGVVTPGARVAAHLGNYVSFRDGVYTEADEIPSELLTA